MTWRVGIVAGLIVGELAGLAFAYQFLSDLDCSMVDSGQACSALRSMLARVMVVGLALGLFLWVSPPAWTPATRMPVASRLAVPSVGTALGPSGRLLRLGPGWGWIPVHLAGVALLLLPLGFKPSAMPFLPGFAFPWLLGATLAATGALCWVASPSAWGDWLRRHGRMAALVGGAAAILPEIAAAILPIWAWMPLSAPTFAAVRFALGMVGTDIYLDSPNYVIALEGFYVNIGQACSGIEGLLLTATFVTLYGVLFRDSLRFPHYWLVMLPLGLALSWALNIVRITALIVIGARVSPELAVNGFHSYAGWMFFTLLAMGLMALAHTMPLLQRAPARALGPAATAAGSLRRDWLAARILPLAAFLLTGTVGAALTHHPDLAFPMRTLAMALALAFFWPSLRHIRWSLDPVAPLAGALIALVWIGLEPDGAGASGDLASALSGLGAAAFAAWVVFRLLGTALLVPVVEELFFRGYLLQRLDFGGWLGRAAAVGVSSALFAALHGRWLEAFTAGLVFAWVALRRDRLGDAIVAHVVANGLIALWAATHGDWTSI